MIFDHHPGPKRQGNKRLDLSVEEEERGGEGRAGGEEQPERHKDRDPGSWLSCCLSSRVVTSRDAAKPGLPGEAPQALGGSAEKGSQGGSPRKRQYGCNDSGPS